jgi:hypothetical protein
MNININDHDTIYELSRFSKKNASYEAEPGAHDDLVMALVLFAWMSNQQYFKGIYYWVLIKYLGLENDAKLSRPQVAKLLHQKFKDAGLKDGSQTTLNEKTVKELKLPKSYNNRVIKTIAKEEGDFTFQTFLKEFYPKKETSIQL